MDKSDIGKILAFKRDAEYHFRKYQKSIDSGNYIESLKSLRSAIKEDGKNTEYRLTYAELLTDMERYSESNAVLFEILLDDSDEKASFESDILFNMGCNFWGLQDYEKTAECFERYIFKYPDGEFAEDAADIVEQINGGSFEEDMFDLPKKDYELANTGKRYMDIGRFNDACEILEKLSEKYPDHLYILNNYALALFCSGKTEKAFKLTEKTLAQAPRDIFAICNAAVFSKGSDSCTHKKYLDLLDACRPESDNEILKIIVTYCELGDAEKAYPLISELMEYKPYDTRILFICAAICANTGRLSEALDIFNTIAVLDTEDTVCDYYIGLLSRAIASEDKIKPIPYVHQVPTEEIENRLTYLSESFSKSFEEILVEWRDENSRLGRIISWGLTVNDSTVRKVSADILYSIHDDKAIKTLKDYLLKVNESDILKNEIFTVLHSLNVKQPYIAYISGKIAEVRVGSVQNKNGLGKSHEQLVAAILSSPYLESNKDIIGKSIEALNDYFSRFEKAPAVKNYSAWATAFIYHSIIQNAPELAPSLDTVCGDMNSSKSSVIRCLKMINNKTGGTDNE